MQHFLEKVVIERKEEVSNFQKLSSCFCYISVIWIDLLHVTCTGTALANTADDLEMQRDGKSGEFLGESLDFFSQWIPTKGAFLWNIFEE